jgi:hypothetical protein
MHDHRNHCGGDWLLLLLFLIAMDSNRALPPAQPADSSGSGCAGCAGALALLFLLGVSVLMLAGGKHDPVPAPLSAPVTNTAYSVPPEPEVRRAQLVSLPVKRAILVRLPSSRSQ